MKTLLIILIGIIPLGIYSQSFTLPKYEYEQTDYRGMWICGLELIGTFSVVQTMNCPPHFWDDTGMWHVRDRQRFTVALTGMAITAATVFILERYKTRRR